jgi:hypothetical protein
VSIIAEFEVTKAKNSADVRANEAFPGEGMVMYVKLRCEQSVQAI